MLFKEYYKIMKEHGIGELLFLYNDKECSILMNLVDFSLNYSISFDGEFYSSNDFDEIVSFKFLSIDKTLEEIWEQIEILSIDGVSENDYDVQICSYNYVARLEQMGKLQWSYSLSFKKSCIPIPTLFDIYVTFTVFFTFSMSNPLPFKTPFISYG